MHLSFKKRKHYIVLAQLYVFVIKYYSAVFFYFYLLYVYALFLLFCVTIDYPIFFHVSAHEFIIFICIYLIHTSSPSTIGLVCFRLLPPSISPSIHSSLFQLGEALHILPCLPTEDIWSGGRDKDRVHQSNAFKTPPPVKTLVPTADQEEPHGDDHNQRRQQNTFCSFTWVPAVLDHSPEGFHRS